jgi:hypothetical protein
MIGSEVEFRQGMAMLADPEAAGEWRRALQMVDAAAAAGHPQALERRALFECMGAGRQADWNKAVDSLASAAERGSGAAARQLILLAEARFEADPGICDWNVIRSRVSVRERLAPRPHRTLLPNPLIRTVAAMVSEAECEWLISASKPRLERAMVHSNESGEQGVDPGRTNSFALFNFVDLDVVVEMIRTRIAATIGAPLPCLEVSQVLRYGPGEEFAPHCDFLDPQAHGPELARRGQRAATLLVYLNEDFEGGETSFPQLRIEHRGKTGDALLFSNVDPAGMPNPRTKHAGRPPTRGVKWLFSQWVRDRLPA